MLPESCPECVALFKEVALAKEAVYLARENYDSAKSRKVNNLADTKLALANARIAGRLAAQALKDHVERHGPHQVVDQDELS